MYISLSFRFNHHFPGGPGLAGTRMSPFWILLVLRMMEVVMTTGAIRCAKLLKSSPPTYHLSTGRMHFLSPNQQCRSTDKKTECSLYIKQKYIFLFIYKTKISFNLMLSILWFDGIFSGASEQICLDVLAGCTSDSYWSRRESCRVTKMTWIDF